MDLIDISGGTYFPGAPASSDRRSSGPYFVDFARRARTFPDTPLMLTGGFKTRAEAAHAVATGATDLVGLARTMAVEPDVAARWLGPDGGDPHFPTFESPPAGGITAWFAMRLTTLADGNEVAFGPALSEAIDMYVSRDAERIATWQQAFAGTGTHRVNTWDRTSTCPAQNPRTVQRRDRPPRSRRAVRRRRTSVIAIWSGSGWP